MILSFSSEAWEDYVEWQRLDPKIAKRVSAILSDMPRSPYEGIGKPEPLKHQLTGWWSRRIDQKHRIVYRVKEDIILIAECRDRYT